MNDADIRIDLVRQDDTSGQWAGYRPHWIIATHVPTGIHVRVPDNVLSQHKARHIAITVLEIMLAEFGVET